MMTTNEPTDRVYSFTDQHGNRHILPTEEDLQKAEAIRREKHFQVLEDAFFTGVVSTGAFRARMRAVIRGRYA